MRPVDGSLVLLMSGESRRNGTRAIDLSRFKNDGTVYGAIWRRVSPHCSGLSFDGVDDYVEVADNESLHIVKELTVAVWVKFNSLGAKDVLCAKFQSGKYDWLWWVDNTYPDELRFYPGSDSYKGWTTNANLQTGLWYHAVVVYDGNGSTNQEKLRIYINGEAKDMDYYGTLSASLPAYSIPVHIGDNPGNPYSPSQLNGLIGEVRIYNRALSGAEISALYSTRKHLYGG